MLFLLCECSSECRNVGVRTRGRKNGAVENVEKTAGGSYLAPRKCHHQYSLKENCIVLGKYISIRLLLFYCLTIARTCPVFPAVLLYLSATVSFSSVTICETHFKRSVISRRQIFFVSTITDRVKCEPETCVEIA